MPRRIRLSPAVSSTKFIWKSFNTLSRYYMLAGSLVCEQDWHKLLKGSGGAANATGAPGAVRKGKVGRPRRSRDWAPPARAPKPPPPQPATPPDFEQVFITSLFSSYIHCRRCLCLFVWDSGGFFLFICFRVVFFFFWWKCFRLCGVASVLRMWCVRLLIDVWMIEWRWRDRLLKFRFGPK